MKAIRFRFFYFLLAAATVFNFTSCDKDDNKEKVSTVTIDFEDVTLNPEGYWNGSDLSGAPVSEEFWGEPITNYYGFFKSGIAIFNNKYIEEWFSWSGFACSSLTDKTTPGYINQYSVYGNSGADGSKQFAVACNDVTTGEASDFQFQDGMEKTIQSIMVNNSTYVYLTLKEGNPPAKAFEAGDWFKITFTGYNAQGAKTGEREFYLADFQNGKSYICSDWTKVELSSLGKVNKIEILLSSSDTGDWGMNTPAYVCIDNLVYEK